MMKLLFWMNKLVGFILISSLLISCMDSLTDCNEQKLYELNNGKYIPVFGIHLCKQAR